jgi:CheY-like chemotaxis protein
MNDTERQVSHIVILDDSERDSTQIRAAIEGLFRRSALGVTVENLSNPNELPKFLSKNPDIVICDVSLDGQDDIKGLELIENYKRRYPHVAFAAMTSNLDQLAKLDQIEVAPEFLLPKNLLLPEVDEKFGSNVISLVLQNTRQNRGFEIHMPTEVEVELKHGLAWQRFDSELVHCLIRQVFSTNALPTSTAIDFERTPDGKIKLPPPIIDHVDISKFDELRIGESGSVIVKATPKAADHANEVSVVLKFCAIDSFSSELRNFVRYVKWTLPYAWRVDVLGSGRAGKYGVIGYSLAFAGSSKSYPMSRFLNEGDPSPIITFISNVFDETRKVWYRNPKEVSEDDLLTRLTKRYFKSGQSRNRVVDKALDTIQKTSAFSTWPSTEPQTQKRLVLRRLIDRIFFQPCKPYRICICHGDLHGGNIMVSENKKDMVFIDFQDTGHHHVFTDFVFFENALRKDGCFPYPKDIRAAISDEREEISLCFSASFTEDDALTSDGECSMLSLIRATRLKAFRNFPSEDRVHYFLHSLVLVILMFRNEKLENSAREKLAAFFIACSEQLAERIGPPHDRPVTD